VKVFILFLTDVYKSRESRVFFGVYDTKAKAVDAAGRNDLYGFDSAIDILEAELNQFEEL
jgi:hypothetical protein